MTRANLKVNAPRRLARSWSALAYLLFALGLSGQTLYCFMRPIATPDTYAYVSLLSGAEQQAFRDAAIQCPNLLPGEHNGCGRFEQTDVFKEISSYSAGDYATFLRFYTVKPLYMGAAQVLHHGLRLPPFVTLRLLSAASYLWLGIVLLLWFRLYAPVALAATLALLLVCTPLALDLGKFLLPDGFSAALLFWVLYVVLYVVRRMSLAVILLALVPLARPDNILFCTLFLGLRVWQTAPEATKRVPRTALLLVGSLVYYIVLQKSFHALSFTVLFNHSFLTWTPPSTFPYLHLSTKDYAKVVTLSGFKTMALFFPLPLFLAALTLADPRAERRMRDLVAVALVCVFGRMFLFPGQEERYYTWFYLMAAIAAATTVLRQASQQRAMVHVEQDSTLPILTVL